MNNEKYNQIIDEAYESYKTIHKHSIRTEGNRNQFAIESLEKQLIYTKEEFINKCKTDSEFSEKWGLKIEERELSEKERIVLSGYDYENRGGIGWNMLKETVDMDNSIPRKLITITYNNETIEVYE